MSPMRILCLLITIFLVCLAEAQETYITFGHGMVSCGQYVEARRKDNLDSGLSRLWLNGYLTRFSRDERIDTFEIDLPSMMLWIESYCIENPFQNFAYAAARLTVHLQEQELVTYSE